MIVDYNGVSCVTDYNGVDCVTDYNGETLCCGATNVARRRVKYVSFVTSFVLGMALGAVGYLVL